MQCHSRIQIFKEHLLAKSKQKRRCAFVWILGGARRDRTADPLLAKQVLSQLSYDPYCHRQNWWVWEDLNLRPHPYQGCALTN